MRRRRRLECGKRVIEPSRRPNRPTLIAKYRSVTQAAPPIETTNDAFLDGKLWVRQPVKGARAAIDALFLAAAVPAETSENAQILEAGTGSGIVSLSLASRLPNAQISAIDIEPVMCALATENVERNGFASRITIIEGDVTRPLSQNLTLSHSSGTFHHVLANPPFFLEGKGRPSPDMLKSRAHRTKPGELEDWLRFLTAMAAPHGTITLIHAVSELPQILTCLNGRFGNLKLFPLFPKTGTPAKRFIITGTKGSKAPLQLAPGITLHEQDGSYTPEADAVLRKGNPLTLGKS